MARGAARGGGGRRQKFEERDRERWRPYKQSPGWRQRENKDRDGQPETERARRGRTRGDGSNQLWGQNYKASQREEAADRKRGKRKQWAESRKSGGE